MTLIQVTSPTLLQEVLKVVAIGFLTFTCTANYCLGSVCYLNTCRCYSHKGNVTCWENIVQQYSSSVIVISSNFERGIYVYKYLYKLNINAGFPFLYTLYTFPRHSLTFPSSQLVLWYFCTSVYIWKASHWSFITALFNHVLSGVEVMWAVFLFQPRSRVIAL